MLHTKISVPQTLIRIDLSVEQENVVQIVQDHQQHVKLNLCKNKKDFKATHLVSIIIRRSGETLPKTQDDICGVMEDINVDKH